MLNESAGSGRNFVNATVTISGGGGSGATARAVLGPPNGIGADPRDELKATSLMFNSKPDGTENGDFLAGNDQDFRQVMLIRNPRTDSDNGTILTATTNKALRYLKADSAFASQLSIDELKQIVRMIVEGSIEQFTVTGTMEERAKVNLKVEGEVVAKMSCEFESNK